MPRVEIKRNADGSKNPSPKQGDELVVASVTLASGVDIKGHEDIVWRTATGDEPLHQSKKISGTGSLTYKGYIHSSTNTLFLVTRLDTKKRTIQIDMMGKVKAGVHDFS